nr:RuBisCO subunit binding-protein beta subunit precursor [Tanacetum cinerariifolium]
MPPRCQGLKECTESCAAMLIAELRRRFCIPQGESVDKQAANKLNEANDINGLDAQQKNYTDDELLAALGLLEPPENFLEHQWRVYKSHLRKPIAK